MITFGNFSKSQISKSDKPNQFAAFLSATAAVEQKDVQFIYDNENIVDQTNPTGKVENRNNRRIAISYEIKEESRPGKYMLVIELEAEPDIKSSDSIEVIDPVVFNF